MEKIYQIRLEKVSEYELFQLFGYPNPISEYYGKYYLKIISRQSFPFGIHPLVPGYGIYDSSHELLGELIVEYINNCNSDLSLTIYIKDERFCNPFSVNSSGPSSLCQYSNRSCRSPNLH